MLLAPLGLATCSRRIMTFFRTDYAAIALCQALKAGVAIPLIETFINLTVTMNTVNKTVKIQLELLA